MTKILVENISKHYGSIKALDQVTLELGVEVCGILGVNGAGKSTLLKLLAGVMAPDAGKIWIDEWNAKTHPYEVKKLIGYLPEDFYAYEQLTGGEFLEFMASIRDVPDPGARVEYWLRYFGMYEAKDALIKSYSYGMVKRIGIMAALLGEPSLLILDEPLGALDIRNVYLLRKKLKELHDRGSTILISSHVFSFVEALATRIVIVHKGKIMAHGSASDLKRESAQGPNATLEDVFFELIGQDFRTGE